MSWITSSSAFADAPAFLIAAVVLAVLGIWMLVPLLWVRKELLRV